MKPTRLLISALLALAALAGCGGTASESAFQAAAPNYQALSMDLTSSDEAAPSAAALTVGAPIAQGDAAVLGDDPCHPHLFLRTHHLVERVNRHLWFFLRHVEGVIHRNPDITSGSSQVWERVVDGIDIRFTLDRTGETFTWKLEMKKVGDAFVTVLTGDIDRTNAQGAHQGVGDMTLDLGALASVTGKDVQGVLSVHFETFAGSRLIIVDANNVVWDTDADSTLAREERNAHYVYERQPGKGGSIKVHEQLVFACPNNPSLLPADVEVLSRWFRTSTGSVHGRSDALMTGGQLPAQTAPITQIVGVTCHDSAVEGGDQAESYWLMKAEGPAPTFATIVGASHESSTIGSSACDATFGPVPTLADSNNDFNFGNVNFDDDNPYPIPTP